MKSGGDNLVNKHNKILGNFGEDAACRHLENKDYDIIARNYRFRGGEIDIIAERDNTLVFVEVKTRQTSEFGEPAEAVDLRKLEKIALVVEFYLANNDWSGEVRVDVIEVFGKLERGRFMMSDINHIENIIS